VEIQNERRSFIQKIILKKFETMFQMSSLLEPDSLSGYLIVKSFRVCALMTVRDGSENEEIHCLKSNQPYARKKLTWSNYL